MNGLENMVQSVYNENTLDEVTFYFNEREQNIGDKVYLREQGDTSLTELEIVHLLRRSDAPEAYDMAVSNEYILPELESVYGAETSAEFITDRDCYLVWLR